jgi:hypothetical protein
MKKSLFLLVIVLFGIIMTVIRCQDKAKDTCQQDTICESKEVTACCTDTVCVYKFDGKEYKESQMNELAIALGCPSAKSTDQAGDLASVSKRLKALMDRAHHFTKSGD